MSQRNTNRPRPMRERHTRRRLRRHGQFETKNGLPETPWIHWQAIDAYLSKDNSVVKSNVPRNDAKFRQPTRSKVVDSQDRDAPRDLARRGICRRYFDVIRRSDPRDAGDAAPLLAIRWAARSRVPETVESTSFRCFDFLDEFLGTGLSRSPRVACPVSREPSKEPFSGIGSVRADCRTFCRNRRSAATCHCEHAKLE